MPSESIAIASDHGGYDLKLLLCKDLRDLGYDVVDLGTDGPESVDYPDYGYAMASAIRDGRARLGVLLCGTGIGVSIAANRFSAVRAAVVHDAYGARLSRQHNDANVLCMGGRTIGPDVARECLRIFLETSFDGGRHARRVEKLSNPKN
ncbi:MAG: ribose 5-phosphate isomerase B [Rhodospirillales bacterium]|jgi:ribose 5-phosphate isomerase B|nr:ribose 5-phosphate isomerase B [Rhodospirillales bacterium]